MSLTKNIKESDKPLREVDKKLAPFLYEYIDTKKGRINWEKLRKDKTTLAYTLYDILFQEVLEVLKEKGKMTDFLGEYSILLFREGDWTLQPFHRMEEKYMYFTRRGRNEVIRYVRDFLKKEEVIICKPMETID